MAKVNFKSTKMQVLFNTLLIGDYFIYGDKLYLKISDISGFDFNENEVVLVGKDTKVILKDGNDIEITVK